MEEVFMTNEERDIQRKLKVLQHAEKIGNARKACRYFGIGRSSFYRWRDAYQKRGEAGWKNVYFFYGSQAAHIVFQQKSFQAILNKFTAVH